MPSSVARRRHADVGHDDVGRFGLDRRAAARRRSPHGRDDLDPVGVLEHVLEPLADEVAVVGEDDADRGLHAANYPVRAACASTRPRRSCAHACGGWASLARSGGPPAR